MNIKISVVVAIYNIENYLRKCLESICNQSFKYFECILVDDGSIDSSSKICDEYVEKDSRFKVIHKKNEGLPQARKSGYTIAQGEFLLFVDGDDWLESNALELLYSKVMDSDSDIVISDFYKDYIDKCELISFDLSREKNEILYDFMKKPSFMNFYWNKLIKKSLFDENNDIQFPKNISNCEDLVVIFKICYYARKISKISKPIYHYNQCNSNAITKTYSIKSFNDKRWVVEELESFINTKDDIEKKDVYINFYKLYTKLMLVIYPNLRNSNLWEECYPDSNKYIWKIPLRLDYRIMAFFMNIHLYKVAYFIQNLKNKGKRK